MGIHAIIWDVGGVLERTENYAPREELLTRLGKSNEEFAALIFGRADEWRVQLGEITTDEHWQNVAGELGITLEEFENVKTDYFSGDRLDMELVDHIRELKPQYCIAMLSNYFDILRSRVTNLWQIDDAFHHMIISSEVGLMKPDPAMYNLALEIIGYEAKETVFIDDSRKNIQGAKDVGLHTIHFEERDKTINILHEILDI